MGRRCRLFGVEIQYFMLTITGVCLQKLLTCLKDNLHPAYSTGSPQARHGPCCVCDKINTTMVHISELLTSELWTK